MNKASGGYGISAELFQILKDYVIKVLHLIYHQIWELGNGHRTGKAGLRSNPKAFLHSLKEKSKSVGSVIRV